MKSIELHKIASSEPVNITAALVTGKGIDYIIPKEKKWHEIWSEVPLPTVPSTPHALELTGKKFGRLTVIGRFALKRIKISPSGRKRILSKWVVRCECGIYEIRRSQGLRGHGHEGNLMCWKCQYHDGVTLGKCPSWGKYKKDTTPQTTGKG